ncbi:MAG: SurA N-terminal domain-containing protein, partial [Duncaniella sp.]|nr:SurA N-terminal domain-containing protein [Duncaniella sp.]
MATLEKIRSKSVLLLIIVGAALLAFIIGDFFTSGRTLFGTGTTIAKVGNTKVSVHEFQQRVQAAQQQVQASGQRMDASVLQQQVLEAMIAEKLFKEETQALGLTVTDNELTEMMVGKNSAYVDRMVSQQFGLPDAATFHDMAFNPTKYGIPQENAAQLQAYWLELENNVENMLMQQKFQNLFNGLLVANDLDSKAIYDDNNTTANIILAKKDFSSLADADFAVESSDLTKLYDSEKSRYALDEPVRLINYISVNIIPSAADLMAGQKKVEDALVALNEQEETNGLVGQSDFLIDRVTLSQADVDKDQRLKAALDTLSVGRAVLVNRSGNDYNLAKLLSKSQQSDKVTLDMLMVQGSKAQIDSLTAALNSGVPFDSVAASPLVAQSQKATEVSLLDGNASMVKELIADRATGVYFAPDTLAENGRIIRVAERAVPTTVYELANVTYTTEPSIATINELESSLNTYVATHKNAAEFADSAQAGGYTVFPFYVTPSSSSIGNLNDTHSAVAWVMDAKKGEVSPVMGDVQSGHLLAVALNDIYEDYTPARDPQLKETLTRRARNNKKAEKLIADYSGKASDVAGYAQLMGDAVDTVSVNFGQQFIPGLGVGESDIQGLVAASKVGELVGPVKGNNA